MECVICGRRGHGVREWGIVAPGGTVIRAQLCSPHSTPLSRIIQKGVRERRRIGASGLDELVDDT